MTIGYQHAFFQSTWDTLNQIWVDSTVATPGPTYYNTNLIDLSPTGVIATGAQVGCLSCKKIHFATVQYFGYPYCKFTSV